MANYSNVNFIKHLLAISEKFIEDSRLSPLHISLYYALFQLWNLSKFRIPISVNREELMRASKIGSANTYTKCLKELDMWHYIKYYPSHNPYKGSQIHMYNFNKTTNNGINISTGKSINKTTEKTNNKSSVKVAIPYSNTLNDTNVLNNLNSLNEGEQTHENNPKIFSDDNSKNNSGSKQKKGKEKSSAKKEKVSLSFGEESLSRAKSREQGEVKGCERPLLQELKTYFAQNNYPEIEADKFYNHYESNGWLVGGKTPMQNWQASANNWILNSNNFKSPSPLEKGGRMRLNAKTNKNYNEPL